MVLLLFFCSGATALIYEVVWSKYLSQLLGSTVQAQTVVLAVFMGGLALGNRAFGKWADRTHQPLALYGRIEIAIGIYAFFFHEFHGWADALFRYLGGGRLDQPATLLVIKAVLSVGLLIGPTLLMGGTLPLLASWLQRQSFEHAGRWSARFYSVNSLGAVTGSFLAGFYLIKNLGMVSSLQLTALANVFIGLAAIGLSRRIALPAVGTGSEGESAPPVASRVSPLASGCVLVAITGGVSMGLEVLSARSLVLIFGASLQSFAIVLMAFILGIGLGSSVVASPRWKSIAADRATLVLLVCAASVIGVLVLGITQWVDLYTYAKNGLAQSVMGYRYYQILTAGMSLVVLGIPAALLGAVVPLWIRNAADCAGALGGGVGRLLTWNTVGAVVGTLVTGFVLMPIAGLRGSFFILAICVCGAGILTAAPRRQWRAAGVLAGLAVVLGVLGATTGAGWRDVLSSGMFRIRSTDVDPKSIREHRKSLRIAFYEDAADATVSVEQGDGIKSQAQTTLRINGKADATTKGDLSTQYLLGHLPMLARPEAKDIFVLGFGSGITAGALLGHPIQSLTIAENCEPVIRAAHFFYPLNRGVWTNSITRLINDDARTVLKLGGKQYDVIISEPSNPWMAGVGSVFSLEFYQLAASQLKEGGIMTQWFHAYEMNDGIVSLVLRTFSRVFPHMEVWDTQQGDLVMLGSQRPWKSDPEVYQRVFARAEPRKDFERIGLTSPEAVWARQLASQRTAFAVPGEGPIQSDHFPVLEYQAPQAFFVGAHSYLLLLFDERTWQTELASEAKRSTLNGLAPEVQRSVFTEFLSLNGDLSRYMRQRFPTNGARAEAEIMVGDQQLPCVFRPLHENRHQLVLPPNADPIHQSLLEAEHRLRTRPESWRSVLEEMAGLIERAPKPSAAGATWSPMPFVNVAARTALGRRDYALAGRLIRMGMERDSTVPHLRYLARIYEREVSGQTVVR
ncbi:MAG: hypothetical protein FJ404_04180 [Verrucomicrobia bacterium]|nr:hypothetical protein [Verrucomicrobiota bacterium]